MTPEASRASLAGPQPIAVTVVGGTARHVLATSRRGAVLAVFQRALYIEGDRGGLVCLGPRSLGAGPLNALCADADGVNWESFGPAPGARVGFDQHVVEVRGGPAFRLSGARDWRPPEALGTMPAETIDAGLAALVAAARERVPAAGMAPLLAALATRGVRPSAPDDADPFLRTAAAGVATLKDWLVRQLGRRDGSIPTPPSEAAVLIGLGPGLTPSGDDFVGGALIALRYLSRNAVADPLADWALALAMTRTGSISRAHLTCAAEGAGAGALHALLAAVCAADCDGISRHLPAIDAIGHCSGWDALAGAATACASVVEGGDDR